jgi:hypothetical protein
MSATSSPLLVVAAADPDTPATTSTLPVHLALCNVSEEEVRILRTLTPVPVFFSIDLTGDEAGPVFVASAGKADPLTASVAYLVLRPGELFGVRADLIGLVDTAGLVPGRYRLSVAYHNQYGEDCFVGTTPATTLELTIGGDDVA